MNDELRDETIRKLYLEVTALGFEKEMSRNDAIAVAINFALDAGYAAAQPQWVPTAQEMPQWEKPYLWQYKTVKGKVTMKVQHYMYVQSAWFASVYDAWMPLPEPYGEQR